MILENRISNFDNFFYLIKNKYLLKLVNEDRVDIHLMLNRLIDANSIAKMTG